MIECLVTWVFGDHRMLNDCGDAGVRGGCCGHRVRVDCGDTLVLGGCGVNRVLGDNRVFGVTRVLGDCDDT